MQNNKNIYDWFKIFHPKVDMLDFSINELISQYVKFIAIEFLEEIREYEHQNGGDGIAFDERTSDEFYEIYLNGHKGSEII